jgi:diguanylate cyclase (GGDEF)-like protein
MDRPFRLLLIQQDPDTGLREELSAAAEGALLIESASELGEALRRLSRGGIDVVLLELSLPDSEGMSTFERMYAFAPDVPVVVLTDRYDEALGVSAVQAGAQDYLLKRSADSGEILRALRYALERHRLLTALRSLSLMDDLTSLYNRRGFTDLGSQYLELARRSGREITLVFLDLDRFKTINDSLGHHVGDRALRKVADTLRTTFRRSDIIARMGGDEFAALALEASNDHHSTIVERLREHFSQFNGTRREPYQISVSIGVARDDGARRIPLADLLAEADANMYEEKRSKLKNRSSAEG